MDIVCMYVCMYRRVTYLALPRGSSSNSRNNSLSSALFSRSRRITSFMTTYIQTHAYINIMTIFGYALLVYTFFDIIIVRDRSSKNCYV
jgi:hypothetical protein